MKTILFSTLFAISALGQPGERSLPFKQLQTVTEMNEAATVIRSIGEIRNLIVQPLEKTLTVNGTSAQTELTEWLLARIDRTVTTPIPAPAQLDFRPIDGSDTVVRVLYFKNTDSTPARNEMAVVVRSLIEIPSVFMSQAAGAMVIRGSLGQADAAQWVFESLDSKTPNVADRHRLPGGGDDTVRLFAMSRQGTMEEFYRLATGIRAELRARQLYTYSLHRVIAIRGTEELIARAAERLANR